MAIKKVNKQEALRPIDMLRNDFKEFDESDFDYVELVGYENFLEQSIRGAARNKVEKEFGGRIKYVTRMHKRYLVKL